MACSSFAGFQSGSNINRRLAPIKFKPQPPAFELSIKRKQSSAGSLKRSTTLLRFLIDKVPSKRTKGYFLEIKKKYKCMVFLVYFKYTFF